MWAVLTVLIGVHSVLCIHIRRCPERSIGLLEWSDPLNWDSGQVPYEMDDVIIDKPFLLDIDPPPLHSIIIKPEGYLVWGKKLTQLKVHWIKVEGEMHIGGKDCLYQGNTRVTFLGDIAQMDEFGFDKGLYVVDGGKLEIHGERKLPWTKLTETAYRPLISRDTAVVDKINTNSVPWDEKALLVYHIDPISGVLVSEEYFEFSTTANNADNAMANFKSYTDAIPDGDIIAIAVLKKIDKSKRLDLSVFENQVAMLGFGSPDAETAVRGLTHPEAYAFLTKKGSTGSTTETVVKGSSVSDARATQVFDDVRVSVRSYVLQNDNKRNFVQLIVTKGVDNLHPKLTLLDDVTSWKEGDEVVVASTDFDLKQAETRKIIKCTECGVNQIRLSDTLDYTHYGEIYKNTDMRAEVGLLSRNIRFDSEAASDGNEYGGHLKFTKDFEAVNIEGAEFVNLGTARVLGRYSIHFHMCGDVDGRQYIRENSIHDSFTRCVTVHGTHNAQIIDNVCVNTKGHSYFLEDGAEKFTVFNGNLGLGTDYGSLILSDIEEPTTFWVTNPNTFMRNNVAAGSVANGFWYVYPDEPLGLSTGLGDMLEHEARYTPVPEFVNNVAHSNGKFGLNMDFILKPDGKTTGYNHWVGKEDPKMHALFKNSTNKRTDIEGFTGFKNSERHTWIRCGLLYMHDSSFAESATGTVLIRMTKDNEAFFYDNVVIGLSDNIGEPFVYEGQYKDRSYPIPSKPDYPQIGWEVLKKPDFVENVWFHGFPSNREYSMGAIGFRINSKLRTSPQHKFSNVEFSFDDPREGNRVINYPYGHPYFTDEDGDENESFTDLDGSVTGVQHRTTVVLPHPFHLTSQCLVRENWHMAICNQQYATIRVNYGKNIDEDEINSDTEGIETSTNNLIMARDDFPDTAFQEHDIGTQAPFVVITGGSQSYSMRFTETWPDQPIKLFGLGITKSEFVQVGMCVPKHATIVDMTRNYPTELNSEIEWQRVDTLEELDNDFQGNKFFHDQSIGYLAFELRHEYDQSVDSPDECPQDKCLLITLELNLQNADPMDVNCFPLIYDYDKNIPSNDPETDDRFLPSTSDDPPVGWGAGPTKFPRQ